MLEGTFQIFKVERDLALNSTAFSLPLSLPFSTPSLSLSLSHSLTHSVSIRELRDEFHCWNVCLR